MADYFVIDADCRHSEKKIVGENAKRFFGL